jgi:hypothetical protein
MLASSLDARMAREEHRRQPHIHPDDHACHFSSGGIIQLSLDAPIALDGNSLSVYIARDGQINP